MEPVGWSAADDPTPAVGRVAADSPTAIMLPSKPTGPAGPARPKPKLSPTCFFLFGTERVLLVTNMFSRNESEDWFYLRASGVSSASLPLLAQEDP